VSRHKDIQLSLYDYLDGTLDEERRAAVEEHLHSCSTCAGDLSRMQEALALAARPDRPASVARSEEFWATFATAVEGRISRRSQKKTLLVDAWDLVHSYLFFHRGSFALTGMAAAMILLAIVLVNRPAPTREVVFVDSSKSKSIPLEPPDEPALRADEERPGQSDDLSRQNFTASAQEPPLRVRSADNRMSQYLRKSKILLIGIANLKTDDGQPVDLSVEQRTSRELVREARYLRQRPLNPRVDQLVDEMSRILIELANVTKDKQVPNMEIIRSGIHQENLLFKIRMAEAVYDSAHLVYAKGQQQ
jgi:hypothetical protein